MDRKSAANITFHLFRQFLEETFKNIILVRHHLRGPPMKTPILSPTPPANSPCTTIKYFISSYGRMVQLEHLVWWYFLGRGASNIKMFQTSECWQIPIWPCLTNIITQLTGFDPQPNYPHCVLQLNNHGCHLKPWKETMSWSVVHLVFYRNIPQQRFPHLLTKQFVIPFRFNMAFRDVLSLKALCNKVISLVLPTMSFVCFSLPTLQIANCSFHK